MGGGFSIMKRVRKIGRTVISLLVCFCLVEVQPFYPFYGEVSAAGCTEYAKDSVTSEHKQQEMQRKQEKQKEKERQKEKEEE